MIAKTYKCHRAKEWIKFLEEVDKQVPLMAEPGELGGEPHALQIHIIADNYATHKTRPFSDGWQCTRGSMFISRRPVRPG